MKGIVFTSYDSGNWSYFNTAYQIFQKTFPNWKATFYMDAWAGLSAPVKAQVLTAQSAGIEIANHSTTSTPSATYLATHTEEEYYTDEVLAQQNAMIADGITPPTSFAYPAGEGRRSLSNLILSKGIAIKLVNNKTCGIFSNPAYSKGYYKSIFAQGLGAIGHEDINSDSERSTFDLDYIISQLDYCKANNDVYIHSGHAFSPTLVGPLTNLYTTISKLSKYVACNGMSFYTMNDLIQAGFVGSERGIPSVSVIIVTGTQSVGNNLTATYTYQEDSNATESGTTFQWYRADDAQGTNAVAIGGATSLVYTLVAGDSGKYVRIGITPKTATQTGYETFSKWFAIA